MQERRRFKQTETLKDRLEAFAKEARKKAMLLSSGPDGEKLLKKARRAEIAAHIDDWANSPGLQSPR